MAMRCGYCRGQGSCFELVPNWDLHSGYPVFRRKDCEMCNGTGWKIAPRSHLEQLALDSLLPILRQKGIRV
jgi:hypothetical protein